MTSRGGRDAMLSHRKTDSYYEIGSSEEGLEYENRRRLVGVLPSRVYYSTSDPATSLYTSHNPKPLVEYCTNEWQNLTSGQSSPEFDEDWVERFWDTCFDIVASRRVRRWALLCTAVLISSFYIHTSILVPHWTESRLLFESLALRPSLKPGRPLDGLWGTNIRPSFLGMTHIKALENQYLPTSTNNKRLVFVGDIHGCKAELEALLKEVKFNPNFDHLVSTGDIVCKGPDSLGVIDLLRSLNASCVRGNHDDRVLLLHKDQRSNMLQQSPAPSNTDPTAASNEPPSKFAIAAALNPQQLDYLQNCPVILTIPYLSTLRSAAAVVHAGLVPSVSLSSQDPVAVMYMRTIDLRTHVPSKDGKEGIAEDGNRVPPQNVLGTMREKKWPYNVHWAKLWNKWQDGLPEHPRKPAVEAPESQSGGEQIIGENEHEARLTVIYGHDSPRGLQIQQFTKGLDSGCVRGGKLTALIVDARKARLRQVRCKDYRRKGKESGRIDDQD